MLYCAYFIINKYKRIKPFKNRGTSHGFTSSAPNETKSFHELELNENKLVDRKKVFIPIIQIKSLQLTLPERTFPTYIDVSKLKINTKKIFFEHHIS